MSSRKRSAYELTQDQPLDEPGCGLADEPQVVRPEVPAQLGAAIGPAVHPHARAPVGREHPGHHPAGAAVPELDAAVVEPGPVRVVDRVGGLPLVVGRRAGVPGDPRAPPVRADHDSGVDVQRAPVVVVAHHPGDPPPDVPHQPVGGRALDDLGAGRSPPTVRRLPTERGGGARRPLGELVQITW